MQVMTEGVAETVSGIRQTCSYCVAFVLCAAVLSASADDHTVQAPPVFPSESWDVSTPMLAGMDESLLEEARDYALAGGGSGLIVRGGKLVYSWGDPDVLYELKSTTKSIGVTALGLAWQDGLLELNDSAIRHLPRIGVPPQTNAATGWLGDITILHLATHTAGFDKTGDYVELSFEPGSMWAYSDGGANWLADVLTVRFGTDLRELLSERVFEPIGISSSDLSWRRQEYRYARLGDVERREFGSGIQANVDALARLGYLYLRKGIWNGRRILPEEFVERLANPVPGIAGLPVHDATEYPGASDHYGLLWWNNGDGTLAKVPTDAFWSWGLGDSLIIVIPSLDMVVARAGDAWRPEWNSDYAVLEPFLEPIVESAQADSRQPSEPPYPGSTFITGIEWAPASEVVSAAPDSDTWPITWGDDGDLYTAYGDGWGFEPKPPEKLSLGYARISGNPPDFIGVNIPSPTGERSGNRERGEKASGMLMVDGVLYQWVRNANNKGEACQLAASPDRAVTWQWSDWQFAEFGYCAFVNFGKNYAGARDDFVYMYASDTPSAYEAADHLVLMRVSKDRILDRSAYEFFRSIDAAGEPVWTSDLDERMPVFIFAGGVNRFGVTYNAPLGRHLMTMRSGALPGSEDLDHFSIFEAPEPWGPWATVYYTEGWEGEPAPSGIADWGEAQHIPAKWVSADGRQLYLVFSGGDAFAVRGARLTVDK